MLLIGDAIMAKICVGRFGKPEDIVGTCINLASPASGFVNGAEIRLERGVLSHIYKPT